VAPAVPAPVPGSDSPVVRCEGGRGGDVAPAVPAPVPGSDPPMTGSAMEVGGARVWHLLPLHLYLEVILL
jgi:hypothetical protein